MATAQKYIEGIGRRKQAVARVRLIEDGKGDFVINNKKMTDYTPQNVLQHTVMQALRQAEADKKFSVSVLVSGGGITGQAEAIRLGTARALVKHDADLRGGLKKEGFLKRDARVKERYKFGLKKARKSSQWSKR